MNTIDCPPYAPILMESTRAIGYSIGAAVADIIDNSITAHATKVGIWFLPYDEPYVAILDNGCGMDPNSLTEAMRYGSCNPKDEREEDDMGRYGLGLKMASLSQSKCLTVVTKYQGELCARRWDLDFIAKAMKWSLLELNEQEILTLPVIDKLREYKSGTLVIWSQLDRIEVGEITLEQALDNRMKEVRDHLEFVFHRYLSGDGTRRVSMSVNDNRIFPLILNHKARYNNDRDIKIFTKLNPGDLSDDPKIADIMPYTRRNGIFRDKYYRLCTDKPCKTITAHMEYDGNMYIHPDQARGLTPREAARIQTYPDNYFFCGPYTKTYAQIGNSVPPLIAKTIAEVIKKYVSLRFAPNGVETGRQDDSLPASCKAE